jgi:hypothetical protein
MQLERLRMFSPLDLMFCLDMNLRGCAFSWLGGGFGSENKNKRVPEKLAAD